MKRLALALVVALIAQMLGVQPAQAIRPNVWQPHRTELVSVADVVPAVPVLEKAESGTRLETARPTAKIARTACVLRVLLPVCDANGRIMASQTYRHCYYQVFHAEIAAG